MWPSYCAVWVKAFFARSKRVASVERAAVGLHLGDQRRVVGGVGDDGDMAVVLGRRAHHRRAADVDVLDGVVQRVRLRHRRDERVEVDAHQVDVRHAVLRPWWRRARAGRAAPGCRRAPSGCRVLTRPSSISGKAGVLADVDHRQAGIAQRLGGAAGGQQFDAGVGKRAGEIDKAGFVGHGEQGSLYFRWGDGHDGFQSERPCSRIFLRRVLRLMPSMSAARVWLPSARSRM